MNYYDLFRIAFSEGGTLIIEISPWILGVTIILIGIIVWRKWPFRHQRYRLARINVDLGGVGKAEFQPNIEDIQIAHKIWTELVTRKAVIPFDPENDVILEIYDSWYELFTRTRQLIGEIPGDLVRKEESTRKLVHIAIDSLNQGLRPHLTKWHSRFRSWYLVHEEELETKSPQELQKEFPEYFNLEADLKEVNNQLIQYSKELEKIVKGEEDNNK